MLDDLVSKMVQVLAGDRRDRQGLVQAPSDSWRIAGGPAGTMFVLTSFGEVVRLDEAGVEGIGPGTTVISYRGTDAILNNDISGGSDVINGWGVGPTLDNPRGAAHAGRVCHKRSCAAV